MTPFVPVPLMAMATGVLPFNTPTVPTAKVPSWQDRHTLELAPGGPGSGFASMEREK